MLKLISVITLLLICSSSFASSDLNVFIEELSKSQDNPNWLDDYYKRTETVEDNVIAKNSGTKKELATSLVNKMEKDLGGLDSLLNFASNGKEQKEVYESARVIFEAYQVNLGLSKGRLVKEYSLKEVSSKELFHSEDSKVVFDADINSSTSTVRFVVDNQKFIPLSFEVDLFFGLKEVVIPLFERESFFQFYDKYSPDAVGGLLLVDLHDDIEKVEINKNYNRKIYLNSSFKKVSFDGNYQFVLFTGIEQGNLLIQYESIGGDYAEKIVTISDDEIYYDYPLIENTIISTLDFYEEGVLTKNLQELNLGQNKLLQLNGDLLGLEVGLNRYQVPFESNINGMNKVVEFRGDRDNMLVSFIDSTDLVIPSREYVEYISNLFDLGNLSSNCIVELSPKRKIEKVEIEAYDDRGKMPFEMYYFDKDGIFDIEPSDLTEKVFIIGNGPGSFYLNISYENGKTDYLKSFCSNGNYLTEQF